MSDTVSSPVSSRLRSIDCLRGCAALAVMVSHAINYGDKLPQAGLWFHWLHAVLDYGHIGVPLFFVISGFCIHLRWAKQYAEKGNAKIDFVGFWKRRMYRLYPPYFVMLCLSMILVAIAYKMGSDLPLVAMYPEPKPTWMTLDFLAHVFMLHGLHPLFDKGGGNPPFWTLAREEYFYMMYFGLLAWRWRWGAAYATLIVFALGLVFPFFFTPLLLQGSPWWTIIHSSAVVLWIQWCLGLLAVEAHYGLIKLSRTFTAPLMILVWIGVALTCDRGMPFLAPLAWGLVFFTLVNACAVCERKGQWPHHRVIDWLAGVGIFSYSLYLIHNPVRAVIKQLLGPMARTENPALYLGVVFVICVTGYIAAKLYFSLVESRFLNTKPQQETPVPTLAPLPVSSQSEA